MDSLITILIYVGAFILIAVAKSIGGSAKKKGRPGHSHSEYAGATDATGDDLPYQKETDDYARYLQNIDTAMPHIEADYLFEEGERVFLAGTEEKGRYPEEETGFILDDFDLKSAIIYSEILKRPDY